MLVVAGFARCVATAYRGRPQAIISFGTWTRVAQGVPLRVVQETLGHTLFSTTADIYSHVLPVLMADAAEKMNAALSP